MNHLHTVIDRLRDNDVRVVAAVAATIALGRAFGVAVTAHQETALLGCISAWLLLVVHPRSAK